MLTKILAFLSSSRLPSDKHTKTIQGVKTVCEKPLPTGEPRLLARGHSLNAYENFARKLVTLAVLWYHRSKNPFVATHWPIGTAGAGFIHAGNR